MDQYKEYASRYGNGGAKQMLLHRNSHVSTKTEKADEDEDVLHSFTHAPSESGKPSVTVRNIDF